VQLPEWGAHYKISVAAPVLPPLSNPRKLILNNNLASNMNTPSLTTPRRALCAALILVTAALAGCGDKAKEAKKRA